MLTNFCVSLIDHCETLAHADFGPLVVETAVGADELCFSQEGVEGLLERCAQLFFVLRQGPCRGSRDGF